MAVIWGLDLREMQWGKFKSSYMFNTEYHLRRSKMVVYQIAMILCVCSESVGTAALSEYVDQQEFIARQDHLAVVYNDDFVGIMSYNIFVGVAVATIFGAAFFFDLFWPERQESPSVHLAWKICAVIMCVMGLADALAMTVIVATKSAYLSGPDAVQGMALLQQYLKPTLSKLRSLLYPVNIADAISSLQEECQSCCLRGFVVAWLGCDRCKHGHSFPLASARRSTWTEVNACKRA